MVTWAPSRREISTRSDGAQRQKRYHAARSAYLAAPRASVGRRPSERHERCAIPDPLVPLTVALDATSLLDTRTGVGQFTSAIGCRLARRADVHLRMFAVSWRGRGRLAGVAPAGAELVGNPVQVRLARALWRRDRRLPVEWLTGRCDVVHGPNFVVPPARRAAEIVTVHDLTSLRFPELCTAHTRSYPTLIGRALDRGAWVHTVSEFVAEEVRAAFPADPARVVAISNGFTPLDDGPGTDAATGRRLAGGEQYVVAVGTVEPRKNLPVLVEAFDELAAAHPDLRLVLAGPDGWGAEALTAAVDRARHRSAHPAPRLGHRRPAGGPGARGHGAGLSVVLRGIRSAAAGGDGCRRPGGDHHRRSPSGGGG